MKTDNIFEQSSGNLPPLAVRMRPASLDGYLGQEHITGEGKLISKSISSGQLFSLILWGPPGTGKTTLARIISNTVDIIFYELSAVTGTVKDVREIIKKSEANRSMGKRSVLFLDEIHRFSKNQQDALLPAVENGSITLIGATTENPSFQVIAPLLSRSRILRLYSLESDKLESMLKRALKEDILLSKFTIDISDEVTTFLAQASGGDARKMYNTFEIAFNIKSNNIADSTVISIEKSDIETALQERTLLYDRAGDYHYDTISAFIKSVRGSDPDAAIYWLAVMLEGGEDPVFIARRCIILASEDVGNAEPYALSMAVSGLTAVQAIGMPESSIILAQLTTYLAAAPKSNASYLAIKSTSQYIKENGFQSVPLHLRNAPTSIMKQFKYGLGYKYPHSYGGFIAQDYLPEQKPDLPLYNPGENGYEKFIKERLAKFWINRYNEE